MSKWNIFFTLKGAGGIAEAPNNTNPVESPDMATLLSELANKIPGGSLKVGFNIETVGIKIEAVEVE